MKTISLTEDEEKALLQLLDIAVRSAGLSQAGNAVYFLNKLNEAKETLKETIQNG